MTPSERTSNAPAQKDAADSRRNEQLQSRPWKVRKADLEGTVFWPIDDDEKMKTDKRYIGSYRQEAVTASGGDDFESVANRAGRLLDRTLAAFGLLGVCQAHVPGFGLGSRSTTSNAHESSDQFQCPLALHRRISSI